MPQLCWALLSHPLLFTSVIMGPEEPSNFFRLEIREGDRREDDL